MQAYSNPKRASDPYSLPDVEVFQLTAAEAASQDEDLVYEYMKRPEFRLASMNSHTREAMLDAIVKRRRNYWWLVLVDLSPWLPTRFLRIRAICYTIRSTGGCTKELLR